MYACSTRKDSIINRNYHALTTKYNILYNGNIAFNNGIEEINNNYKDDWFEQLSIEPIAFEEDKFIISEFTNGPGAGFNDNNEEKKTTTTFERAEEKAVKAIQKHGMNINGIERNSQIDDAYLLLGKSRYYQQRFIPAVEAFNYVIANYPNADLIAETKIWRAKSNIRLDNEEIAIEAMNLLLVVKDTLEADLPNKIKEQAHTAMALAYVKSDSLQKAKKHLQLATRTLENKAQGARNLFVLGQIYSLENKKDSANYMFNKLANFKKAPYKYKIHANIELAKNASNDSTAAIILNTINELIEDRENRPYLDELYYQAGVLYQKNDSISLAINNYNKSLQAENAGDKQKTFTYEKLGNLYFKENNYKAASAYYDSVLQVAKDTLNLRVRRIKRKYNNLASLINFEETVSVNDSILKIVNLSEDAQRDYFQNYIEKIKTSDEEAAQLRLNQLAFANTNSGLQDNNKGNWYFYNSQSLSFGKNEYQKIWGTRKLEDNWRWSNKSTTNITLKNIEDASTINPRYNLDTYLSKIPKEKNTIDSLKITRNKALYELGLIYKEQFKNLELAKQRLERVASLQPKKELILPINWHLYQINNSLGNTNKANTYKDVILTDFPETKFAQVILNPDIKFSEQTEISEVESTYKEIYYLYKSGKFNDVIEKINTYTPTIPNAALLPKFELLKALAIGKIKSKEAYIKALEFVEVNYSNTEEGKKAKEILALFNK